MFLRQTFAERLSAIRHAHKLTASELAKDCGLSQSSISSMELGTRSPSIEVICTIADYFNVSVDYLLGNDTQQPNTDPLFKQVQQLDLKQRSDVAQYIAFVLSKNQPKDDA